jgi:hypothetical protein
MQEKEVPLQVLIWLDLKLKKSVSIWNSNQTKHGFHSSLEKLHSEALLKCCSCYSNTRAVTCRLLPLFTIVRMNPSLVARPMHHMPGMCSVHWCSLVGHQSYLAGRTALWARVGRAWSLPHGLHRPSRAALLRQASGHCVGQARAGRKRWASRAAMWIRPVGQGFNKILYLFPDSIQTLEIHIYLNFAPKNYETSSVGFLISSSIKKKYQTEQYHVNGISLI